MKTDKNVSLYQYPDFRGVNNFRGECGHSRTDIQTDIQGLEVAWVAPASNWYQCDQYDQYERQQNSFWDRFSNWCAIFSNWYQYGKRSGHIDISISQSWDFQTDISMESDQYEHIWGGWLPLARHRVVHHIIGPRRVAPRRARQTEWDVHAPRLITWPDTWTGTFEILDTDTDTDTDTGSERALPTDVRVCPPERKK